MEYSFCHEQLRGEKKELGLWRVDSFGLLGRGHKGIHRKAPFLLLSPWARGRLTSTTGQEQWLTATQMDNMWAALQSLLPQWHPELGAWIWVRGLWTRCWKAVRGRSLHGAGKGFRHAAVKVQPNNLLTETLLTFLNKSPEARLSADQAILFFFFKITYEVTCVAASFLTRLSAIPSQWASLLLRWWGPALAVAHTDSPPPQHLLRLSSKPQSQ